MNTAKSTVEKRGRRKVAVHQEYGSIATGNRWGGEHQHKREKARRKRQTKR